MKLVPLAISSVAVVLARCVLAVTAPYADTFDSYANGVQPANFVTSFDPGGPPPASASWATYNPNGTGGSFEGFLSGHRADTSAAISVTNVDNVGFSLSTTFVVRSTVITSFLSIQYVGLGALSSSPDFSNSGYQLYYDTHDGHSGLAGNLFLSVGGPNGPTIGGSYPSSSILFSLGTTYTMTLQGNYTANGLMLTGTLTDGTTTIFANALDISPQHGTYFGFYEHVDGSVDHLSQETVDFDNFTIDVPEPTTTLLMFLGSIIFGATVCWRRKSSGRLH